MSEAAQSRALRLVAVGAALVALVLTLVAAIVVLVRDGGHDPAGATSVASPLRDHEVHAADAVRLQRNDIELVRESGTAKGVRVTDAALARSLGLEPGDVITSISGKPIKRELDAYDAILKLSMLTATTLYIEIVRSGQPVLLRWHIDGDLRQERYSTAGGGLLGSAAPGTAAPGTSPATQPDPLADTIEKIDDTHYRVPRATIDALFANPMKLASGARIVASFRMGQADGVKLYAIRPASVFAKLGFMNGDTLHAINGFPLDAAATSLDVFTQLHDATSLRFGLSRRGQPLELYLEITK